MLSRNENKQIILEEIHYNVVTGPDFLLVKCYDCKSLFVLVKLKRIYSSVYDWLNRRNANLWGEQAINSWNKDESLLNFYAVYQAGVAKIQYNNSIPI